MADAVGQKFSLRGYFATAKGRRLAWYFYDFGNSAYAAVILLAIYSAYFKQGVVGGAEGTKLWGYSIAIAMVVVAIISPILGTLADHFAIKKRMLAIFTLISAGFTGCLFFVQKGDVFTGMLFFILAEIGYRSAQVYYDAFLPEIAERKDYDKVSGNGWAIGSFGGIVCLLIVLPLVVIFDSNFVLRLTLVITAIFYLFFTLPLILFVKETATPTPLKPGTNVFTLGFKRLWQTLSKFDKYREYFKFMIAFILYNDGVMIALNFAAIIGAVLYGFGQQQLIILILLVGLTNTIGAWVFGTMSHRSNARAAIFASMACMVLAIIWLQLNPVGWVFYLIGSFAGFAIGGLQSVSRTMVARLAPPGKSAEFFGLFAVAGRSSSVVGPALFGWIIAHNTAAYIGEGMLPLEAEQLATRIGLFLVLVFMALGGLVLLFVKEDSDEYLVASQTQAQT
ncbi:MAG: MFS transporter [Salaquimonas sp.]